MTGEERPAAPIVRPGPDPARDARVAARRAADARRAGRALDRMLTDPPELECPAPAPRGGGWVMGGCGTTPDGGWYCRPYDCDRSGDCPLPTDN